MKLAILAIPAIALAACADGSVPTPTSVGLTAGIDQFCAIDTADAVAQPASALGEWAALYNRIAPRLDREVIPSGKISKRRAKAVLDDARQDICE